MITRAATIGILLTLALTGCSDDDAADAGGADADGWSWNVSATDSESQPADTETASPAEQQPMRATTIEHTNRCFAGWARVHNPASNQYAISDLEAISTDCDAARSALEADRRGIAGPTPLNRMATIVSEIQFVASLEESNVNFGVRDCIGDYCRKPDNRDILELNTADMPASFTEPSTAPRVADFDGVVYAD